MVLLKNAGLLPLKDQQSIAVIGRSAENAHFQGGGSSHINTTKVTIPFKELQSRAENAELTYAEGYPKDDSFRQDLLDQAVTIAKSAEVALLYIALPTFKESEGLIICSKEWLYKTISNELDFTFFNELNI